MTLDHLPVSLLRSAALATVLALVPTACATAGKAEGVSNVAVTDEGRIYDLREWGLGKAREAAPLAPGPGGSGKYLAARQAQMESDTRAAAAYYLEALENDPDNADLVRRAYFYLVAEGRVQDAVPLARRALELEPDGSVAPLVLAASAAADERFAAAGEIIARLDARGLNAFMVPILRAWTLAGQDRTQDALASLNLLAEQPQFADLYAVHAALIADLGGDQEAAAQHYNALIADAPTLSLRAVQMLVSWLKRQDREADAQQVMQAFAGARTDSGLLSSAIAQLEAAGDDYRPVSTAKEGMAETFYGAATTLTQSNALDTALVFAQLARHLDPGLSLAQMLIGDILARMGRLEEANEAYAQAEDGSISWYTARLRMADNMERMGRLDTAVGLLEEVARRYPDRADPLVVLGDIHRRNDQWDQATAAYDRALDRVGTPQPEHWSWLYSRGIAHERAGRWDKAEADFRKALELEPDQPFVLNYLGYSWIDRGENLEEGRRMIEAAVAQRPRDGYIVDSLGWVQYLMGNYEDAVRHLERAVELSPADATINDHLGDAYWRVGRRTEARFQWRRALDMDPEQPGQAEDIREKIETGLPPRDPSSIPGQ